jgi:hypothetical protein
VSEASTSRALQQDGAVKRAPPSGAALIPSFEPSARMSRDHVGVGDGEAVPPLSAHGAQDEEVADRLRHAQAVGDGARVWGTSRSVPTLFERP